MITDEVRDLLIAQVGHELNAHQAYYGISLYFEGQSLAKWAGLFRAQSVEEAQHAAKIISFLVDNGIPFELPAIGPGTTRYASAREAVRARTGRAAIATAGVRTPVLPRPAVRFVPSIRPTAGASITLLPPKSGP